MMEWQCKINAFQRFNLTCVEHGSYIHILPPESGNVHSVLVLMFLSIILSMLFWYHGEYEYMHYDYPYGCLESKQFI